MTSSANHNDLMLFSAQEIRDIEAKVALNNPGKNLMKKAGREIAALAKKLIKHHAYPILMIAGPGNNGGDACSAAADLAKEGFKVIVILCAHPETYSTNAKKYFEKALSRRVTFKNIDAVSTLLLQQFSIIIDGIYGIGLNRPISGKNQEVIQRINHYAALTQTPILSIDVPSGLNANTGTVISTESNEGVCIKATCTLTFLGNKPGLHTADGKDYAGDVIVADLDVDPVDRPTNLSMINTPDTCNLDQLRRKQNSHKGHFGEVTVIGGAQGMVGAPILAARSALYAGAGKVTLGLLAKGISYDALHPEIMCNLASDVSMRSNAIVIGPGLGTSTDALHIVSQALQTKVPIVVDADALNLIAANETLTKLLQTREKPSILTPHPLEAARLLKKSTKDIQDNRLRSGLTLSEKYNATVILKGSGSIICNQHGHLRINTTGNPGLATGGTGDVLAGLCGALLAQGLNDFDAGQLAAWLHGKAADYVLENEKGPIGMNPSELPSAIRHCLNQLIGDLH